jgi:hypothetical protein
LQQDNIQRIVDPNTGGEKEQKLAQLGAVDPLSVMAVAEVAGFGTQKYARYNFARGYKWSLSYDALQRHLHAWWGGEDKDPESKLSHLAHAAWHCLALLTFVLRGRGTDDRFTPQNFGSTVDKAPSMTKDAEVETKFQEALAKLKRDQQNGQQTKRQWIDDLGPHVPRLVNWPWDPQCKS